MVDEELGRLPGDLDADEELLELARATHGSKPGLVAVTDRRVLFLYRKDKPTEVALATVTRCTAKGRTLTLRGTPSLKLEGITPRERAAALEARINALAESPPGPS